MFECVEDAFRHGTLVLATTTYNTDIFPFMKTFINELLERGYQKRKIALIENGSWAPTAAKNTVTITSALNDASRAKLEALAEELCADFR